MFVERVGVTMSKECVWIRPETEVVVPKFFADSHTDGNCLNREKVGKVIAIILDAEGILDANAEWIEKELGFKKEELDLDLLKS